MYCEYVNRLISECNKLEQATRDYLTAFDKLMAAPASYDRGAKMAELNNALFRAVVSYHIDADQWRKTVAVKDMITTRPDIQCPMGQVKYPAIKEK